MVIASQDSQKHIIHLTKTTPTNNCYISICSYNVPIKRLFLPLIGSISFTYFPLFQTFTYLPCLVFVTFFVIFWNFPSIIVFMNSKPLYYEDLFVTDRNESDKINPAVRNKFENAFEWSLIFTNALFTSALSEYWLYQAGNSTSYVEILGVTGGILKIFQSINQINGGIILNVTRFYIERELKNASHVSESEITIELSDYNESVPPITDNPSSFTSENSIVETTIHTIGKQ